MPPKANGGMAGYVTGKNGNGGAFDDLRADVPNLPNSKTTRSKSHETRAATGRDAQRRIEGGGAASKSKKFYETDTNSIGGTSTTASIPSAQKVAPVVRSAPQQAQAQNSQEDGLASDEEYATDSEGDENFHPTNPLAHTGSQRQNGRVQDVPNHRGRQPDGNALGHMTGDTYPNTTDGTLSVSDIAERKHRESNLVPPPMAAHAVEGGHYLTPPGTHPQHQVQGRQSGDQQAQDRSHQHNGLVRNPAPATAQIQELNPYAQPGPKKLATRQGPPPVANISNYDPTAGQQSITQHPPSTNSAQKGSTERGRARIPLQQPATAPVTTRSPVEVTPPPNEKKTVRLKSGNNNNHVVTPTEQHFPTQAVQHKPPQQARFERQGPMQPPQYDQMTPEVLSDGAQVQHKQEEEDEVPVLDYDLPALYKMEYDELKAATFDNDPNSNAASVEGQSLEEKMQNASSLQPKLQASFFTTLDIGQWEQAGDWFLGRFGEIMGQLKRVRQEKRKAAREFEDEIEKRYNAIDKKRKFTDDALSDMKMSGGKVLQGTPKKAKKTQ
ncbi:hypothetical protein LTR15_006342 [Elasticomyces elasticus]|nr:hypothetical protein LTR15_006342 [Elasticomyces elasticus]